MHRPLSIRVVTTSVIWSNQSPNLDAPVPGARDEPPVGGVKRHARDLLIAVSVGEHDGFVARLDVPDGDSGRVTSGHHLGGAEKENRTYACLGWFK